MRSSGATRARTCYSWGGARRLRLDICCANSAPFDLQPAKDQRPGQWTDRAVAYSYSYSYSDGAHATGYCPSFVVHFGESTARPPCVWVSFRPRTHRGSRSAEGGIAALTKMSSREYLSIYFKDRSSCRWRGSSEPNSFHQRLSSLITSMKLSMYKITTANVAAVRGVLRPCKHRRG